MRRRRRPQTAEEKIRSVVLRRRRAADRNARRRAEKLGAQEVAHIKLQDVAERDHHICYLCGKEVSVHDATFEHVIPLSDGGVHTPENVRLAHGVCNSRKGAKLLAEIDFSKW